MPGLGREVGAEVERLGLVVEEHRHGPAALPGRGLHGLHVDGVDVGPLLAVHLDVHEVLVHVGGGQFVLEGLVRHDVTPVTARIPHAEQHRHTALARLRERRRRPGPPVDGVVGVLEQIRRGLVREAVRHGPILPHHRERRPQALPRSRPAGGERLGGRAPGIRRLHAGLQVPDPALRAVDAEPPAGRRRTPLPVRLPLLGSGGAMRSARRADAHGDCLVAGRRRASATAPFGGDALREHP